MILAYEMLIEVMKKILTMPTKYEVKKEEYKLIKEGWTVISGINVPSYSKVCD